ncbi:unnamed protein product [Danaus chrysippus]|uniref:(African queen) hypothetical protein n=1 Tax=Danaus chrysippus TaxID=151541 RepID=A0A8J2W741_9NEOP|nr:unnamed protein product [Danaus chrysippus]
MPPWCSSEYPIQYIVGCKATQGSETTEWAGSVTLLGLLPLWRATLPPDTVLAVRPPTPGDCWPFRFVNKSTEL